MIASGSLPGSQRSQYTLSEKQINDLLLHELEIRNRIILELFLYCGLRRMEVRTLEIARIDFDQGQFSIVGKGYHGRVKVRNVPLPTFTADKLKKWIGKRKTGYVFPGRDGPHLSDRAIQDIVAAAGRRIDFKQTCPGLKYLNPHTLRHTFARRMKNAGFDYEDMALLLGHENIFKTVSMYGTKTFAEVKRETQARLFQNPVK